MNYALLQHKREGVAGGKILLKQPVNTTSKTTFNNDQPRNVKEKDLWLETLFRGYSWDVETHCYEKPSKSAQIAIAQVVR